MDILEALSHGMPSTYFAAVVVLAVSSQWIAWKLKIPSILLLLVVGFGFGQVVSATDVLTRDVLYAGVSITVGIILFEGSLTLKFSQLRGLDTSVRRLCSVTVALAWPLIAVAAWLAGVPAELAVLLGALLVVTGPTVINPIVRQLRPTRRTSTLLMWEGIIVDPIGAVLATLVFQVIVTAGEPLGVILFGLVLTVLVGFGLGFTMGWLSGRLLARHAVPDHLEGVVFLGLAVGVFVASNVIQAESGLLTVTVMGVTLANQKDVKLHRVREFKEHLQVLFVGSLFVLLAGQITFDQLAKVLPTAAIFIPLLLIIRPLSIYGGLWRTDSTMRERTLLAFMAPRGIVAAAVTSIFALELHHHAEETARKVVDATDPARIEALTAHARKLDDLALAADGLVPLVFGVVVATVAIYGLGVGRLAERLNLATSTRNGVLFVCGDEWIRQAAVRLQELGVPVRILSTDYGNVSKARNAGIDAHYAHVLSEHVLHEMDFAGLKYVIAATADDELNATAIRELGHTFGSANCFHMKRMPHGAGSPARQPGDGHLTGKAAFLPPATIGDIEEALSEGRSVRRTKLSREFTREQFYRQYGRRVVVLFTVEDGDVRVMTAESELPKSPVEVIALLPPRQEKQGDAEPLSEAATGQELTPKELQEELGEELMAKGKEKARQQASSASASPGSAPGAPHGSAPQGSAPHDKGPSPRA